MNKKDYIQRYTIQHAPLPKGVDPIDHAEKVWARLSARGYGHKAPENRDNNKDWYKELSQNGKARFDEFWKTFSYKHNRNNAAMRWHQMELNGISDEEFEQITFAAKKEAEDRVNRPSGSVPIMGQGWLNNMRWKDTVVPSKSVQKADENKKIRAELIADISHFKNQLNVTKDDFWIEEINKAEAKLKEL